MKESAVSLDEVKVTASAPELKQKPGKVIYTPCIAEATGADAISGLESVSFVNWQINNIFAENV